MIRFRLTKNVILTTKERNSKSYSKFLIIGKMFFNPNMYSTQIMKYIVLEKMKS